MRVRENIHGQVFDMGRSYPQVIRENVLDLHNAGLSEREISADARVSLGGIREQNPQRIRSKQLLSA